MSVEMSVSSRSADEGPPRKKLRKGTHSCLECRRRKARCVFESDGASVCNGCIARGTSCIGQEYEADVGDNRKSVRERVGRLEGLMESIAVSIKRLEQNTLPPVHTDGPRVGAGDLLTPQSHPSESPSKIADIPQVGAGAPLHTLFNNEVLTTADNVELTTSLDPHTPLHPLPKWTRLRRELLSVLPQEHAMDIIFDQSRAWWDTWKEIFPEILNGKQSLSLREYSSMAMAQSDPAVIGNVLLALAIGLQQMPTDFNLNTLRLGMPAGDVMDRLTSTVERLILKDDDIACTVQGLECMLLASKFYMNVGKIRTAWINYRRAITFAELMGLHKSLKEISIYQKRSEQSSVIPYSEDRLAMLRRKASIWTTLFRCDRFIGLLLGLPYSIREIDMVEFLTTESAPLEIFMRRIDMIIGRVADRNLAEGPPSFALTLQLDQELQEVAKSESDRWWQALREDFPSPSCYNCVLIAQTYYHQIRALVHLPFMLQSATNRAYEYNRLACVESSREMIKRYLVMRAESGKVSYVCKVVDYQAFTAAVCLLLNIYGYGRIASHNSTDQDEANWESINKMVVILREAAKEVGGVVAQQALKVLELLSGAGDCDEEECSGEVQPIVIPFFGTISIRPGKAFDMSRCQSSTNTPGTQSTMPLPTPESSTITVNSTPLSTQFDPTIDPSLKTAGSITNAPGGFAQQNGNISYTSLFAPDAEDNLLMSLGQPWQPNPNFDLDADWSWFLDPNGGAGGVGGMTAM